MNLWDFWHQQKTETLEGKAEHKLNDVNLMQGQDMLLIDKQVGVQGGHGACCCVPS